jgi:hypothetical protein
LLEAAQAALLMEILVVEAAGLVVIEHHLEQAVVEHLLNLL